MRALLVTLLVLTGAAPAVAAETPSTPEITIGFVDTDKLVEAYQKTPNWATRLKALETERGKVSEQMKLLKQTRYLSDAERAEWGSLRAKPKTTDGEKARIAALEQQSDAVDLEFNRIAQVERPSAEQEKRLKELDEIRRSGVGRADDQVQALVDQVRKLEGGAALELRQAITRLVEKAAQKRKLTAVVDSSVIIFGGVDLTPEILKQVK
jgi:Skp family chaperone for outer membrane proteins